MRSLTAAFILATAVPGTAIAQDAAQAPAVVAAAASIPANGQTLLPANTEVVVTLNAEVSSKKMKQGAKFDVSVARDVMIGNFVVIPRGTPGHGEITYRTGKGAFGKSAKMEIDVRTITLNGRDIPISGHYRQEGQGNTGATVAAVATVWVAAPFITGRSAVFEQGRELKAFTVEPLPVSLAMTSSQ
jgi:hypothetical protein